MVFRFGFTFPLQEILYRVHGLHAFRDFIHLNFRDTMFREWTNIEIVRYLTCLTSVINSLYLSRCLTYSCNDTGPFVDTSFAFSAFFFSFLFQDSYGEASFCNWLQKTKHEFRETNCSKFIIETQRAEIYIFWQYSDNSRNFQEHDLEKTKLKRYSSFFFFLFYLFSHVNRIPQLICPINSVSTCYRFHRGIAAMTTFHLITFQRIGTSAIIVGHLDSMTFLRIENFLSYLFLFVRATNFLRSATVRHVFVTVYIDIVGKFWTFHWTIESGGFLGYRASQRILLKNIKQYGYQFIRVCRFLFQRNYLVFPTLMLKFEFKSFLVCLFLCTTVTQCLKIISRYIVYLQLKLYK